MKTLILTLAFVLISLTQSYSQVSEAWRKPIQGDILVRNMHFDNQNNIIISSDYTGSGINGRDLRLLKFSPAGDTLWIKLFGTETFTDEVMFDSYVDNSNNIYVTGYSGSSIKWLLKYDSNGNLLWSRADSTDTYMENGTSKEAYIQSDSDGNIYVCTNKERKMYVLKYTPSGNEVWKKEIDVAEGTLGDLIRGFCINNAGLYIASERTNASFSIDWIGVMCNFNGDTLWSYTNTFGNLFYETPRVMKLDAQGNVYYLVELMQSFYVSKFALIKLGSNGFESLYDGGGDKRLIPTDIEFDAQGNVIVSSYQSFSSDPNTSYESVIRKYSSNGTVLWTKMINGNDVFVNDLTVDANGYIYMTGEYPWEVVSSAKMFIHKISPSGTASWHHEYTDGNNWSIGSFIKLDNSGNAIVAGSYQLGLTVVKYSNVTGISTVSSNVPEGFELSQNYPNPFNPSTKINFSITQSGFVSLKVYDLLGREVAVLVNEVKQAGAYVVDFNAAQLSSGTYFYKIETNGFSEIKKMMFVK
ncbi:MAG TPA: T9SS type A sorting domain-containing protein [Ignavibacteria bacterium]|nr:T9SS type A sorting domain-containing protein [Ignavibacteria bacterium]